MLAGNKKATRTERGCSALWCAGAKQLHKLLLSQSEEQAWVMQRRRVQLEHVVQRVQCCAQVARAGDLPGEVTESQHERVTRPQLQACPYW